MSEPGATSSPKASPTPTLSRTRIAQAVANDHDGFERLHAEAASHVQPALERLRELLTDPTHAQQRSADPDVLEYVNLINNQVCDYLGDEN